MADRGRIRNVCDGHVAICRAGLDFEEDIGGRIGGQMVLQLIEIVFKGGTIEWDCGFRNQLFVVDACQQGSFGRARYEGVEGILEFLRGY